MENDTTDNGNPVENIHDKFFWDVYGRPENAAGFLKDFLPSSITGEIDFDYIEVNKKSFLSEGYKAHYSDIVIETRFKADPERQIFIYFLLEHKSYVPKRAPLQLLRYMVEQWYELEKKGLLGDKLPPVIPILIYQGRGRKWPASLSFQDYVDIPNQEMKSWIPDFQYLLNDTTGADEEQFKTSVIVRCWHIIVKYLDDPVLREKIADIAAMMVQFLQHETALEYLDIFMKYLANTDNEIRKKDAVKAIKTVLPERGVEMMGGWAKEFIDEGLQKGLQQGLQQGLQEGIHKGRLEESHAMLLDAVRFRYNDIREDIVQKILTIKSPEIIKSLLLHTYSTDSLDEFDKLIDKSIGVK